jgi:bifunctional non-homologous end joining protein LigD
VSAAERLAEYDAKRDFRATPEPRGDRQPGDSPGDSAGGRFVIQQHDATRLHWDLRLEHDGVLLSWALPRGLPPTPDRNHLAVHTEDHPLEYLTFHGEIPEGSYGAGNMTIWDHGTYELHELTDAKTVVTLHGDRAQGRYALFQTRGRDWMIHRMDRPGDARPLPPTDWRPMEPTDAGLPRAAGWWHEVLVEGLRVLVRNVPGMVDVTDAAGADVGSHLPEIRRIGRRLGSTEVLLDGTVVGVADGPDSVAARLRAASESTVRRLARDRPLQLVVTDLLWLEGEPLVEQTVEDRRAALTALGLDDEAWRVSAVHLDDGRELLDAARAQGVAGLLSKRSGSRYRAGCTSRDWRRIRS